MRGADSDELLGALLPSHLPAVPVLGKRPTRLLMLATSDYRRSRPAFAQLLGALCQPTSFHRRQRRVGGSRSRLAVRKRSQEDTLVSLARGVWPFATP